MYWNLCRQYISNWEKEGLIETWDVLKFCNKKFGNIALQRLIETWDVLKYIFVFASVLE